MFQVLHFSISNHLRNNPLIFLTLSNRKKYRVEFQPQDMDYFSSACSMLLSGRCLYSPTQRKFVYDPTVIVNATLSKEDIVEFSKLDISEDDDV